MRVHCKLTQFHTPLGSMIQFSGSFARWCCCERIFECILHSVAFYFGKKSHFSRQSGRAGDRAGHKEQTVGGPPRPARPIGSAATVYSAHIDQPGVLVSLYTVSWRSSIRRRRHAWFWDTVFVGICQRLLLREDFRLPKLTLHSDLRRRAVSRLSLPCTSSSFIFTTRSPSSLDRSHWNFATWSESGWIL